MADAIGGDGLYFAVLPVDFEKARHLAILRSPLPRKARRAAPPFAARIFSRCKPRSSARRQVSPGRASRRGAQSADEKSVPAAAGRRGQGMRGTFFGRKRAARSGAPVAATAGVVMRRGASHAGARTGAPAARVADHLQRKHRDVFGGQRFLDCSQTSSKAMAPTNSWPSPVRSRIIFIVILAEEIQLPRVDQAALVMSSTCRPSTASSTPSISRCSGSTVSRA